MNKFGWWALALIFGWLTYRFAIDGAAAMGEDNPKAIAFTAVVALTGLYGATSNNS